MRILFSRKADKLVFSLALGGLLLFGVPALERLTAPAVPRAAGPALYVFDVGQGDAILAQEGDRQILIDGGPDGRILEKLGQALPPGDRKIDLVVLTHPHSDHVCGLAAVLERYEVSRILATDVSALTGCFRRWQELIADKRIPVDDPQEVRNERVGALEFAVLAAGTAESVRGSEHEGNDDGLNDSSIVGLLAYGRERFLLMGDATTVIEDRLLAAGTDLRADFLKVGHHGSAYSTGEPFVEAVGPRYAAVSVGANNSYGNPAWRVLRLLSGAGVETLRTDRDGDLVAATDGESLQVGGGRVR